MALLFAAGHLATEGAVPPSACGRNHEGHSASSLSLVQMKRQVDRTRVEEDPKPHQPHVCIFARTCGPHAKCAPGSTEQESVAIVRAFLASISAQTYPAWQLHLLNGQGGGEVFQELVASFKDARIANGPSVHFPFVSNTWGYEATNFALDQILPNPKAHCEYLLFTNADNLYGRYFLETGLPGMIKGHDLLGFNFVTRYVQPQLARAHMPMVDPGFAPGKVDLGAVLVSAKAVMESSDRFDTTQGFEGDLRMQDWKFFEKILQRPAGGGKVFYGELQYIHQLLQTSNSTNNSTMAKVPEWFR